jgi:hypothetical protein
MNKANNKGNNLDKYDPIISSFPKKDEIRSLITGSPIILNPKKN